MKNICKKKMNKNYATFPLGCRSVRWNIKIVFLSYKLTFITNIRWGKAHKQEDRDLIPRNSKFKNEILILVPDIISNIMSLPNFHVRAILDFIYKNQTYLYL